MVASVALLAFNILWSLKHGKPAGNNPWGARTLEWMISSPPPYYNFKKLPHRVRTVRTISTSRFRIRTSDHELDEYPESGKVVDAAAGSQTAGAGALMAAIASASHQTGHDAVAARYRDVDPVYAETRDIRLLGFVLFLLSDCVLFASFIFAYLYLRTRRRRGRRSSNGHQLVAVRHRVRGVQLDRAVRLRRHDALRARELEASQPAKFNFWLIATIVLGIGFLAGQAHE